MNRPLRVLMIGRNFWPHGSLDSSAYLVRLARDLDQQGVHVEVLTPRHSSSWAPGFHLGRIAVHRPTTAPRSDWSTGRYVRHLTLWLKQNAKAPDVLFADAIREEACAAIDAARSLGIASVVRCRGWGRFSDVQWWKVHRSAGRCRSMGRQADAVIAPSAAAARALIGEGYAPEKIQRITPGFWPVPQRTPAARFAARQVLAAANGDLRTPPDAPVLLCLCRLISDSGVHHLLPAVRHLVARYPNLCLWLVGDGPSRDWIYQQLRGDGVRASIAMPGSFCDVEDLLMAADIYLQLDEDGLDSFLPAAIAAALPLVAVKNDSVRTVIQAEPQQTTQTTSTNDSDPSQWLTWIEEAKPKAIKEAIVHTLNDLPAAQQRAEQLRRFSLRHRPQSEVVFELLQLFRRVTRHSSDAVDSSRRLAGTE